MVTAKIKKIGRRDFDRIVNQWRTAKRRLRRGDGGFEQRAVAQSRAAAVRSQHLAMDGEDRRDIEVNQDWCQAKRLNKSALR